MRSFSLEQEALLQGPIQARLLATFYLDSGTYRFCDDVLDCYNGVDQYIGANAILGEVEIPSGDDLSAEPVTLICDGNRMTQVGISDPAKVFREIMDELAQQRRIDWALGLSYIDSEEINLTVPLYAGKINSYQMVDDTISFDSKEEVTAKLVITIDALASRYSRTTNRTRSHEDQQEISPGDMFYSFTIDAVDSENSLYWGKDAPYASATPAATTRTFNQLASSLSNGGRL